ncbi:MAG: HDOD domain-containing protein [candidate division Zixibacteria bacterium]|nr:HDOD domain-containing protein [candidate division Zixibacteria bacterium]
MDNFQSVVDQLANLPSVPVVVQKLHMLIQDDGVGSREVAKIVETDSALVARVLKLVNSSFYGMTQSVLSVEEAISIFGFNTLHQLVLSTAVFNTLDIDESTLDINSFWRHSFGVGVFAKHLRSSASKEIQSEALTGGILHDIGRLVIAKSNPTKFEAFYFERKAVTGIEQEAEFFDHDHQQIGEMLAKKWNFPDPIVAVIRSHHTPSDAPDEYKKLVAAVNIADLLCHMMQIGYSASSYATEFDSEAWQCLDISMDELKGHIHSALNEIDEASQILKNL